MIVFAGFMGAGKTTLARDAAAALGQRHLDADRELEASFGTSIEEVFDRHGEAAFREREEEVVLGLLARPEPAVVSLGGGAVESPRIREALRAHTVVLCEVSLATAWQRAHGRGRPLARDRAAFERRYAQRSALYEQVADAYLPEGPREQARRAAPFLRDLDASGVPGARMLWARAGRAEHPVFVGRGVLGDALRWPGPGRPFCVTDATVADLHAGRVPGVAGVVEMPPGEEHKTLATAQAVWQALVAQGATRADHVAAVGGGVVGDLAGFCAATYQRGIPVVQVPTTLVAQVDSAYGGKTGVDLPDAKNYVGAYHQPAAVVVDPSTLATLPPAEHAAGYAEVVKTALIAGGALWDRVGAGEPVDDAIILACARTKLGVVAADERDGGLRQVLNLGHTVGHALEVVTGFSRLRHGEAVGLGLLAALRLSGQPTLRDHVAGLLEAVGLPTRLVEVDPAQVAAATRRDKKRVGEHTPFVLVEAPGDVRHGRPVAASDLLAAIDELVRP